MSAADDAPVGDRIDKTDLGNCRLLLEKTKGNLRYVPELKLWIVWTGTQWVRDDNGTLFRNAALDIAEHYLQQFLALSIEASKATDTAQQKAAQANAKAALAWSTACRNKARVGALKEMAREHPGFPLGVGKLDSQPHLLGVANGVVDLRTGKLRKDAREDFVTLRTPVKFDPKAKAPRWSRFIQEISGTPVDKKRDAIKRRPMLEKYMQTRAGYCITGEVREQKAFNEAGAGSNGKNVKWDTLHGVLGPYATVLTDGALERQRNAKNADAASPTIAGLRHKRLVLASEWRPGMKLDIERFKSWTGDGAIKGRGLYADDIEFQASFKIVLPSNDPIELEKVDPAIQGRWHVVPYLRRWNRPGTTDYDATLPDGDAGLKAALRGEYEGILAWAVEGAVAYYKEGLKPPVEVTVATTEYLRSQDALGEWLKAVEQLPAGFAFRDGMSVPDAYLGYLAYCNANGSTAGSQRAFGMAMAKRAAAGKVQRLEENDLVRYGIKRAKPTPSLMEEVFGAKPKQRTAGEASAIHNAWVASGGAARGTQPPG